MKKTKIVLLALVALLCVGATAANKKSQRKGKKAAKEQVEQVDTVCIDTFSYLYGTANSNGLMGYLAQRMGVDTAYVTDFLKGFQQKELTEADKREKARLAGVEIREQVETQVWANANRQIDDSVEVLNHEQFLKGFQNGIFTTDTRYSMDSAQAVVQKQMAYYHKVKMEKKYGANRLAGEEFLRLNAKKDSVKTTPSGLQYKVITMGTGEKPQSTDRVKVDYEGRLIDGTVFDSSYKRGKAATFPVNQVIPGWTEVLCLMPVGSKWEVYIPQELGYKDHEQQKIPPFSCLVFTVELHEIVK